MFFLKKHFVRHKFFSCGHWYPCFRLLVTSPLGFKARVDPLLVCFVACVQWGNEGLRSDWGLHTQEYPHLLTMLSFPLLYWPRCHFLCFTDYIDKILTNKSSCWCRWRIRLQRNLFWTGYRRWCRNKGLTGQQVLKIQSFCLFLTQILHITYICFYWDMWLVLPCALLTT